MNYIEKIQAEKPAHMLETIKNTSSIEKQAEFFAKEIRWSDSASVNVYDVTGTCHPDYVELSWLEMLERGKRMPENIRLLHENPDYYFQQNKKTPNMYYTKVDQDLFVTGDGNHRTCLAKVLFYYSGRTNLEGVVLTEINKDHDLEQVFELLLNAPELRAAGLWMEVVKNHIERRDAPGWKTDSYRPAISICNRSFQKLELNAMESLDFYTELKSGRFLRLLRHNRYAKFIKG